MTRHSESELYQGGNGVVPFDIPGYLHLGPSKGIKMTNSARYIKIVEWSEEDQCFIGCCPGIIGPCCHGNDEVEVYRELCEIVDEWLAMAHHENKALPPPTIGRNVDELLSTV